MNDSNMNSLDILGEAMFDFLKNGSGEPLIAHTSYGPDEIYELDYFFRDLDKMPELEIFALSLCRGEILEIGAGAGSHALALEDQGKNITAMDTSVGCINVMLCRGLTRLLHMDIFNLCQGGYNTLLLLMNGIGVTGNVDGFNRFLVKAEMITSDEAQVIFDSTDVSYAIEKDSVVHGKYFGEIRYQFEYKGMKGPWFDWLYIDQEELFRICSKTGWMPQIIYEQGQGHYLVRLLKKY
jgi:sRNA-binding regulator protein Hfq